MTRSVRDLDFTPRGEVFPSPRDWRDQFLYFLLVDRFDDHRIDPPPFDAATTPRGRDPQEGWRYQGGTLRGVTRRLDYVRGLGCTALWLSPVLKNRAEREDYHGYGTQDFLAVEPRFGTLEDLRELVRQAHARGMYVIQDIVVNHTGDNWSYPGDHPYYYWKQAPGPFPFGAWREADPAPALGEDDAVWPEELQTPDAYKRRGQIRHWDDPEEAVHGDFLSLKELDLGREDVLGTLISCYKWWIAATDVDGFRLDTVKNLESSATAIFCNAVREYARRIGKDRFFLFGEVVGDDALIERYLGRNARIEGTNERFPSLDACLDYPLNFVLEEVLKGFADPARLRERYERFHLQYADHGDAARWFVTFLDNHDQFVRPHRRFLAGNPFPAQAAQAVGYLLTSQGVPCLYYGTEQAFDGGGGSDVYVRECMFGGRWGAFDTTGAHFFDPAHPVYAAIREIAAVRAREPALRYGRQYFREISRDGGAFAFPTAGGTLAFSRILDTEERTVALNLSTAPRDDRVAVDGRLTPPGTKVLDRLRGTVSTVEVESHAGRACVRAALPPHGIAIYGPA